jgi:lactoylglutathione lyase
MHLYESHLPVADSKLSEVFYREVVGLPFAYRDPTRDIVFLWVDEKQKGMLGLWGPSTGYGRQNGVLVQCHVAFAVSVDQLQQNVERLNKLGIETRGFGGDAASEPSVIGWMPSAQIYFRDLDGHSLEFITILPHRRKAGFVGPYSQWITLDEPCSEALGK